MVGEVCRKWRRDLERFGILPHISLEAVNINSRLLMIPKKFATADEALRRSDSDVSFRG
jgi:hypothetical protein